MPKGDYAVDFDYIISLMKILIEGLGKTSSLFVLTLIFSIPLGMLVCMGKRCRIKPVSWLTNIYISIMRGTPLILQIIFVYFAPAYIFGNEAYMNISNFVSSVFSIDMRFAAVVFAFSINYAAYFAEIFRGGLESMPIGQNEAGSVLGFTKPQTFWHITFPQVLKKVLPACGNEVITLVKDTALASVVGVAEMFMLAQKQASYKFSVLPLFAAGVFYYIMNLVVALIFSKTEKKLNYYR